MCTLIHNSLAEVFNQGFLHCTESEGKKRGKPPKFEDRVKILKTSSVVIVTEFQVKNCEKLGIKHAINPVATKTRGKRSHECFIHAPKPLGALQVILLVCCFCFTFRSGSKGMWISFA